MKIAKILVHIKPILGEATEAITINATENGWNYTFECDLMRLLKMCRSNRESIEWMKFGATATVGRQFDYTPSTF